MGGLCLYLNLEYGSWTVKSIVLLFVKRQICESLYEIMSCDVTLCCSLVNDCSSNFKVAKVEFVLSRYYPLKQLLNLNAYLYAFKFKS